MDLKLANLEFLPMEQHIHVAFVKPRRILVSGVNMEGKEELLVAFEGTLRTTEQLDLGLQLLRNT